MLHARQHRGGGYAQGPTGVVGVYCCGLLRSTDPARWAKTFCLVDRKCGERLTFSPFATMRDERRCFIVSLAKRAAHPQLEFLPQGLLLHTTNIVTSP